MTQGVERAFKHVARGVIFYYIPTSDGRGGIGQCGSFSSRIYQLTNAVGTFSRVDMRNRELTIRRCGNAGAIGGTRIVGFRRTFFGNARILVFSSIVAENFSCTHFTYTLRTFKTSILKKFFLNEALLGWTSVGARFRIGRSFQIVRGRRLICVLAGGGSFDRGTTRSLFNCPGASSFFSIVSRVAPTGHELTVTTMRLCGELERGTTRPRGVVYDRSVCGLVCPCLNSVTARRY